MNDKDLYEEIRKIIIQETKYNRFYDGEVVELREGKAVCTINSLGWDTPDKGAICTYLDKNSMTELKIDDKVVIGFRNNDPSRAFIVGMANDYLLQSPLSYNFNNKIESIYDDRSEAKNLQILKDNTKKEFTIKAASGWKIILDNGTSSMTLDTNIELDNGTSSMTLDTNIELDNGINNLTLGATSINFNNGNGEVLP